MSVMPWPDHLLTLEEWDALPEDTSRHYELAEGVLQVAPRPRPHHQMAAANLAVVLNGQLPRTLVALPDIEVVVQADFPATVRAPDVVVTSASRYEENPPRLDAGDVLLAVEIVSPGSRRLDHFTKPGEYAEAGIPHYWVISLDKPSRLTVHTLVDGVYKTVADEVGNVRLVEPASITIDIAELTSRDYPWID